MRFFSKLIFLLFFFGFIFLLPNKVQAADFVVENVYKTGDLYTSAIPYYKPAIAIPFRVPTDGSYKNFSYMLKRSTYVGESYGFSNINSTPYFDNISRYPTPKFFEKLKISVLPSTNNANETFPVKPDFANWSTYGDTTHALGVGGNPVLQEPEIESDSLRYKWLKFTLESGVQLYSDKWYWLIMYPDVKNDNLEEWKFVAPQFISDFNTADGNTNNFGVNKKWQPAGYWDYNPAGDYLGFRIDNPTPILPSKTPVIIIPGIGGSEFKAANDIKSNIFPCGGGDTPLFYPKDTVVWVNELEAASTGCDDYFDVLKLKSDGNTSEYPDVVLNGKIYDSSYGKMIKFLEDNGYENGKTLFVFAYDWRKDLSLTNTPLDNLIKQIKNQTGVSEVDIVAHSMGGLVARNYIKDPDQAANVRKLITLGTPFLGSVEFLKTILYGQWVGANRFGVNIGVNPTEINDVFQNMVGGFELLPTLKYFSLYDGQDTEHLRPFLDQRDVDNNSVVGQLDYAQTKQLLINLGKNQDLFLPVETFHSIDNMSEDLNGVDHTAVVGSGVETLGEIKETTVFNFLGIKINHKDEIVTNGDESVPLLSASVFDSAKKLNLSPNSKLLYVNTKHGDLPSAQAVLDLVKNILNDSEALPTGIQEKPFELNGKQISVHSPVNLHAYDSFGNHTGPLPDGNFEEKIPGSSYDTLEDSKYIWLPSGGDYTLKLEATDKGSFDLDIRNYQNDSNDKTITYQEVPIEKQSRGEMNLISNSPTPSSISLDTDGDGVSDKTINATSTLTGDQLVDQKPPTTNISLSGTLGNNGWYRSNVLVTLNTEDDNSGVLKTEYSLDGGFSSKLYSAPFTISQEGLNNIIVKSTDIAGNQETPKTTQIKIDKSKPQVTINAKPNILWPPQILLVPVQINGNATDNGSGVLSTKFQVQDEYKLIQPNLTNFGQTIKLQAIVLPWDLNGRAYTVKVTVTDLAGNSVNASTKITAVLFKPKN